MKRIALVTDYFRPEPGGLEGLFTGIARRWAADDVAVIVTREAGGALVAAEEIERFDAGEGYRIIRRSRSKSRWSQLRRAREDLAEARALLEQLRSEHVLLADLSGSSVLFARAATGLSIPYSVFLNGGDLRTRLGFLNFPERRLVQNARNVFTVARFIARDARSFGVREDRLIVAPPGFEPRWPVRKRSKLPEDLAARIGDRTLFVGLGPLLPRKGFDYALQALQRLRGLANRMHFLIVGSGPEYIYLQEIIRLQGLESMASMTGFLPDATLYAVLQRADVILQPGSVREDDVETLGAVFMEAAWLGLPSLAGRLGGVEEIVRHGVSGFVVEAGNVAEIAERMEQLVASERLRYQLGKNARDIARSEFDFERTCFAISSRL
ncbi:MAG: glycosyltransferase family 4 protein [Leptospirales bacterium]|nr:glycosyltransferase family 4 protein [Leptospirales bacterium]